MKYLMYTMALFSAMLWSQELKPTGIEPVRVEVDFQQSEIFEKVKTYAEEYLVNEHIKISKVNPGESIRITGTEHNKACYINPKVASKNCFVLDYTVLVTAQDKSYTFEVIDLKASNESKHPGMDYHHWFDENEQVIPLVQACAVGTSEYFQALNQDFKEYIEEGDYW